MKQIWYTGDIITPDDSNTNAYGEPCEEGHGYILNSGWVDFNWSQWVVEDKREDVSADVWDGETWGPMAPALIEWVVACISERIGWVEVNGGGSYYSSNSSVNYKTGQEATYAAHLHGFTDDEIAAVDNALTRERAY